MKNNNIYILLSVIFILIIIFFNTGNYGIYLMCIFLCLTIILTISSITFQLIKKGESNNGEMGINISIIKLISKFILLFLISGTFLYLFVFLTISKDITASSNTIIFSNTELFLRSFICSFDLFLLNVDSNILDRIDNHSELKTMIFIQAILSSMTTAAMFLSLIISRLKALWQLNINTHISNEKSHLYLFFGINHPTELLAKDIKKNDANALIIVIDEANISAEDKGVLESIFSYFGHKSSSFSTIKSIEAVIAIANNRLSDIKQFENDVFLNIGLPKIKKLLNSLKSRDINSPQLHIFLLSNEEERNISDLMVLTKDKTILSMSQNGIIPKIYCHARNSGPSTYLKETGIKDNIDIRIIDSSFLSVEHLKLNEKFHPVNIMDISKENPGSISSPLNCLIVGFGEVGRDAFRFLYEFGAFLDEKSTKEDSLRTPFRCLAIDSNMKNIAGEFLFSSPELQKPESGLKLLEANSGDTSFFTSILDKETSKNLNYIIISTGDDNENINLAIKIFKHIRSVRDTMDKVKILVRCASDERLELMTKLSDFYNVANNPVEYSEIINIFGNPESVFSYNLIIENIITKEAMQFFSRYQLESGENKTWEGRRAKLSSLPLSIDHINELFRKENQDKENALHVSTKIHILKSVLGNDYDWDSFISRYFDADGEPNRIGSKKEIKYPKLSEYENRLILNLAKLEHIRWNASHELLGYKPSSSGENYCNEKARTHNCLVQWQELDKVSKDASSPDWVADYKAYDFNVVDTSISIHFKP